MGIDGSKMAEERVDTYSHPEVKHISVMIEFQVLCELRFF